MLLQHIRSAEPTVEAVITFSLVDPALCASENPLFDIIRAFSAINRTANPDDPRLSNMVHHCFEVFHFIRDSLHRVRFLLHRLGWRSSLTGALICTKHISPSFSARNIASRYLNRLITSFLSLMFAILEVLTILRKVYDNEHYDEVRMILSTLRI